MSANAGRAHRDRDEVVRAVARLRAGILALTGAWFGGAGLFLATAWLLVRGGENVGQHLNLLGIYLPGFSVTWPGAFVGLAWGALVGALLGGSLAWIYNRIAFRR